MALLPWRTPVLLLAAVDPTDQLVAGMTLQCTWPRMLVVRHEFDVPGGTLRRLVSDATGLLEDVTVELDHPCMMCALREEIAPTLARWVRAGSHECVLLCLPVTMSPVPVADLLERRTREAALPDLVELRSVVCAVAGVSLEHDLLGDDLLCEREGHDDHDRRAVGEVLAEQVEYADLVLAADDALPERSELLLRELVRPDTTLLADPSACTEEVLTRPRDPRRARRHVDPTRRSPARGAILTGHEVAEVSLTPGAGVWTVHVDTPRPFHPSRLLDHLTTLGGGRVRGRGCFWLPSRPGAVAVWDGAGGRLSIGTDGPWRGRPPRTRLVLTGVGGDPADVVAAALEALATCEELAGGRDAWRAGDDGFGPWLGDYPASA